MTLKNKEYYEDHNRICHPVKRRDYYKKVSSMLLGIATITATIKIIEEFRPKY
jgi:hypothetical protein